MKGSGHSGGWKGREETKVESKEAEMKRKTTKCGPQRGEQIQREQKVGSRTVELTKTRKQSRGREKRQGQDLSRSLSRRRGADQSGGMTRE